MPRVVTAGCAQPDAAGHRRLGRVVRDHVLVGMDAGIVQRSLGLLPADLCGAQIHQHQVVVGAAADQAEALSAAVRSPAPGHYRGSAGSILLNSGCSASPKATALAAITCISGPPWVPGKTALSMCFARSSLHRIKPPRGPRSVLCVVDGDDVAVRHRVGVQPGGHQPGDVRHIHHQAGAHRIGNLAQAREVEPARVGAGACHNQLGLVLQRQSQPGRRSRCAPSRVNAVVDEVDTACRRS